MGDKGKKFQIAVMGSGLVGKTSLVKRYLYGTFPEAYKETVEDTFIQAYQIDGHSKAIDYIDTAGSIEFPAMREIYMKNANGFILVYSIDDEDSFEEIQMTWEQIRERRKHVESIPCVIVGNKMDQESNRMVETFDAIAWTESQNLKGCFVEVSSKDNIGVGDAFDVLLDQIGNVRAKNTGPFKVRNFTAESTACKSTKKGKGKSIDVAIQQQLENSRFQDIEYECYTKKKIVKVVPQRKKVARSRSIFGGGLLIKQNHTERRRGSFPFEQMCMGKQEATDLADYKGLERKDSGKEKGSESTKKGLFGSILKRFQKL